MTLKMHYGGEKLGQTRERGHQIATKIYVIGSRDMLHLSKQIH